ncbi:MAG: NADAR family protein [bacterium]
MYPTAEHAYQALKFIKSAPNIYQMIVHAKSPLEAKEIKDTYIDQIDPSFEAKKVEVMKEIFLEKAKQHLEVREALRKSGTNII